jgi:hypothetical protein
LLDQYGLYFVKEVIKILPEGLPHTAPVENTDEDYKKSNENLAWITKNKNRLEWDSVKCRYYIK